MRSTLKNVNMDRLASDPQKGSVLVRLMMVSNDLSIANETHLMWKKARGKKRAVRRKEARRYAVRMIIGHIFEGMRIIEEIERSRKLSALVQACDNTTRKEFEELVAYMKGPEFKKLVGMIRHKVAFHYDDTMVQNAIKKWAEDNPGSPQPISLGRDPMDWSFGPGDLVSQHMVVRDIFKIRGNANVVAEADKIMDGIFEKGAMFARFCGHFLWQVSTR
jgi:hypothetical protein